MVSDVDDKVKNLLLAKRTFEEAIKTIDTELKSISREHGIRILLED